MFEQMIRGALWFVVATYVVATCKTMMLAAGSNGGQGLDHVMVAEAGRKPMIFPTIEGTDTPMPLADGVRTSSRAVGLSKLYYAVYPVSGIRNTRYRSFWR